GARGAGGDGRAPGRWARGSGGRGSGPGRPACLRWTGCLRPDGARTPTRAPTASRPSRMTTADTGTLSPTTARAGNSPDTVEPTTGRMSVIPNRPTTSLTVPRSPGAVSATGKSARPAHTVADGC